MRETEYAYSVARIRANELSLLTKADLEQLISAGTYEDAVRMLTDKGWKDPESGADICEEHLESAWNLICESVPDPTLLEAMVIRNDFTNLKAVIKSNFSDTDPEAYITKPCICDPKLIISSIKDIDFEALPEYLADCADKAYHAISGGRTGQDAEIIIDRCSLETGLEYAKKCDSNLLSEILKLTCLVANIKIALRSVKNGKSRDFALEAMCNADFDNKKLTDLAFDGEKLGDYVAESGFPEISEEVDSDFAALEIKCDNLITEKITKAKYDIFGPDPIIAYYYAKVAETKNVRIVLSAKAAGVPEDMISQRVREMYV